MLASIYHTYMDPSWAMIDFKSRFCKTMRSMAEKSRKAEKPKSQLVDKLPGGEVMIHGGFQKWGGYPRI